MNNNNNSSLNFTACNKVKAATTGGIDAMLKVINTHINNIDMCCQACITLDIMMSDDNCKRTTLISELNQTNKKSFKPRKRSRDHNRTFYEDNNKGNKHLH